MSRTLSANAIAAMMGQETSEIPLILIEISYPNLTNPIRVVNNSDDITSNGVTYLKAGFDFEFPTDAEGQISEARLAIDNVDKVLVKTIRQITGAPTINFKLVLASDPDTVEINSADFQLRDVEYDRDRITGKFTQETFLAEPFPGDIFSPSEFPGLL